MSKLPTPTAAERAAPGFNATKWNLRHGLCPSYNGEHEFGRDVYCRFCGRGWGDLITATEDGVLHVRPGLGWHPE